MKTQRTEKLIELKTQRTEKLMRLRSFAKEQKKKNTEIVRKKKRTIKTKGRTRNNLHKKYVHKKL